MTICDTTYGRSFQAVAFSRVVFTGFGRYSSRSDDGRGAEEVAVPLARDLHPEFGYVGSPRLFRKLGLVLTFIVFGLVAAAGGVAVFMADPDSDPMNAMALAPAEPLDNVTRSPPTATATKAVAATLSRKTSKAGGIKSPCRENITEQLGGDCSSGKARKPRSVLAVNERPAIAAVLIGHGDGPAVLPSEPEIPLAAILDIPDSSAKPVDAAEVAPAPVVKESPTPVAFIEKSRTRSNSVPRRDRDDRNFVRRRDRDDRNFVQRRDRDEYSPSRSYSNQDVQGAYARVW
jgi:hypothetical protein